MHRNLFDTIDTARPFLFMGDTKHSSNEIHRFINDPAFLDEARRHGYTKILVEMNDQEMATHQSWPNNHPKKQFAHSPQYPEIGIIAADPRSTDDKKKAAHTFAIIQEFLRENDANNNLSEKDRNLDRRALTVVAEKESEKVTALDGKLLEKILSAQSGNQKVIVIYGAGHFEEGSIVEKAIPESKRNIVFLFDSIADELKIPTKATADTHKFAIDTGSFFTPDTYQDYDVITFTYNAGQEIQISETNTRLPIRPKPSSPPCVRTPR